MTAPAAPGITKQFADFVLALRYEDLPPAAIAEARKGILDLLGVALIGSLEESTQMLLKVAATSKSTGESTVLGAARPTTPTVAALVNGHAAHALDYDDTQHNSGTHMSAAVLPGALVLAEMLHRPGKDLLTAYVTGFEIGCRLGRVARFSNYLSRRGVHATGFLGHFGAAAATGKLMGLDATQVRRCFGISGGHACGLMRSFGTMAKAQDAANAARDGVLSALLAKQGFTAPEEIFDGEANIFSISGGQTDPEELVRGLGHDFEITHNTLKVFACAGWRNPIVEALILLATTHDLHAADVKRIHIHAWPESTRFANYPEPRTGPEAKFSTEHAAAVALIDRAGGVEQFSDKRATDPALAELRRRVTLEVDQALGPFQVRVSVFTTGGRELSYFIPAQKGDHLNPLSWDELVAKFRANASTILGPRQVDRITALIQDLEAVDDVAELVRLCRLSPASS